MPYPLKALLLVRTQRGHSATSAAAVTDNRPTPVPNIVSCQSEDACREHLVRVCKVRAHASHTVQGARATSGGMI